MGDDPATAKARRELQLASIQDVQGSIHANDSKSSAALVVHGLLFAGVLTITVRLGTVYEQATGPTRIVGFVALGVALIAFAVSVLALLLAVRPYEPKKTHMAIKGGYKHVFFPLLDELEEKAKHGDGQATKLTVLRAEIHNLSEDEIERVYAAEAVKLAVIRDHEARRAKVGFFALIVEVGAVAAYLALVGLVAAGVEPLTR